MIAQVCNLSPGKFIHIIGDAHIYSNHIDAVKEQLARDEYELPTLQLNSEITNIFDFKESDIHLMNYSSHPAIKAPMAV
jgi:thymidylate synthase